MDAEGDDGFPVADFGLQTGNLFRGDVGRVGGDKVERAVCRNGSEEVAVRGVETGGQVVRGGIFASDFESLIGNIRRPDGRAFFSDGEGDANRRLSRFRHRTTRAVA